MDKIVGIVAAAPQARSKNDDDFADRLSSRYSVVILVVFAVVVSANQYIGNPITCWAPVHFTGSHTKFANSYCWVRNTYYLPWESEIPRAHEDEKRQYVTYYQWIPFILLGQAVLFYLPTIIWHGLNSKAGVDADNILEAAHSFSRAEKIENRERTMLLLTNQMDRFLKSRDQEEEGCHCDPKHLLSATCCRVCGRRLGNYLVILFMASKVFYIANAIIQLFLLSAVLSISYNTYGFDIMGGMVADHDWTESAHVAFPRVTLCDFDVRRLGNVHRYTVQCVLPLNLYNEKIYMFLWFWIVFVAVVSILSFLVWLIRFLMQSDRRKFVLNHLQLGDKVIGTKKDKKLYNLFLNNYLKQDGAFLLRLIAHNTNTITTTEVICALWELWNQKRQQQLDAEDPGPLPEKIPLDEPDNNFPEHDRLYPDPHADDTLDLKKPLADDMGASMA